MNVLWWQVVLWAIPSTFCARLFFHFHITMSQYLLLLVLIPVIGCPNKKKRLSQYPLLGPKRDPTGDSLERAWRRSSVSKPSPDPSPKKCVTKVLRLNWKWMYVFCGQFEAHFVGRFSHFHFIMSQYLLLLAPIPVIGCPNKKTSVPIPVIGTKAWHSWRQLGEGLETELRLQALSRSVSKKMRYKGVAIELKMNVRVLWAILSTFCVGRFFSFPLRHVPIPVVACPNICYWLSQ